MAWAHGEYPLPLFYSGLELIAFSRWAGFFFAISAFNNSGMSLVDANMVSPG